MKRSEVINKAHEEWLKDNSATAFSNMALRFYDAGVRAASPPPAPPREPLTEEQIHHGYLNAEELGINSGFHGGVRWAESAHGIAAGGNGAGPSTQGVDHG